MGEIANLTFSDSLPPDEDYEEPLPSNDELLNNINVTTREARLEEMTLHYAKLKWFFERGGKDASGLSKSMRETLMLIDDLRATTEPSALDGMQGRRGKRESSKEAGGKGSGFKGGGDRSGSRKRGKRNA